MNLMKQFIASLPDVTVSTVITYSVFSITDRRLLFVNTLSCIYRPTGRRSLDAVFVALLLLLGGVEPNPGPPMGLRLGLINARSAVGKTAVIQTVIESHQLDVLVITETWMNADQPPAVVNDIAPSDYLAVHQFRGAGSGGGVAIVYRRHLKLSVVNISSTATSFEHLTVKLTTKNRRVNLTAIYRPPATSPYGASTGHFCAEFADFVDDFLALPGDPFFCGDFNCPSPRPVSIDSQLQDVLESRALVQHVDQPTHDAGNLLDLFISDESSKLITTVTVVDVGMSDHYLLTADISVDRPRPMARKIKYRNIKTVNPDILASLLSASAVYTSPSDDVNEFAAQIDQAIIDILDTLAPLKSRTIRSRRNTSKWLTAAAVTAKQKRRQLERKWKLRGTERDRVAYRAACRAANAEITHSREIHYNQRLQSVAGDQRAQWRVVRELLHTEDEPDYLSPTAARALCTRFQDFFSDKLRRISDAVSSGLASSTALSSQPPYQPSLVLFNVFSSVSVDEVVRLIRALPPKSSPLDCLPVSLLKSSVDVMAPLLARLANLSFAAGVFPERYKVGRVVPRLKKPGLNKEDPSNYRPITNLCTFSKVLEKLSLSRLQSHINASGKFCPYQSAYRPGFSTETALLKVVNDISCAAGSGKCTALLALDISAAFDAVNHDILCRRLEIDFGISGTANHWLRSFVSGRSQYVTVCGECTNPSTCLSGVPQGSVLGPLLFSVYASPVGDVITSHQIQYHQYGAGRLVAAVQSPPFSRH